MYATKCSNCGQLINLKNEELIAAIAEVEASGNTSYHMACPKCRRPIKMSLKQMKLKVPRPIELPTKSEKSE